MYGYHCEYRPGTVRPRTIERESFKHQSGFIVLEDVTIGVCAEILRAVHEVARGKRSPERTALVPVAPVPPPKLSDR